MLDFSEEGGNIEAIRFWESPTYFVVVGSSNKIELEVEGMGRLHINVKDDLKRTWPTETRLDRLEAARARGENAGYVGSTTVQIDGKHAPSGAKA